MVEWKSVADSEVQERDTTNCYWGTGEDYLQNRIDLNE